MSGNIEILIMLEIKKHLLQIFALRLPQRLSLEAVAEIWVFFLNGMLGCDHKIELPAADIPGDLLEGPRHQRYLDPFFDPDPGYAFPRLPELTVVERVVKRHHSLLRVRIVDLLVLCKTDLRKRKYTVPVRMGVRIMGYVGMDVVIKHGGSPLSSRNASILIIPGGALLSIGARVCYTVL